MGFINLIVDWDDEDDNIFEPERRFSGVFNTFVNQSCVKKNKNLFKLAFRFDAFPETSALLETRTHKKFYFQHYRKTKMLQVIVFWLNHEIKMLWDVLFRLNHEIKMPRNWFFFLKKTQNYNAAKISCLEVTRYLKAFYVFVICFAILVHPIDKGGWCNVDIMLFLCLRQWNSILSTLFWPPSPVDISCITKHEKYMPRKFYY